MAARFAARAPTSATSATSCRKPSRPTACWWSRSSRPGGHWSSYPPHKHDTATTGEETALEETYYHRLNPPQGFAFQRVYTDDRIAG